MLTLPASCDGPPARSLAEVASWTDRERPALAAQPFPRLTGCNRGFLPFRPSATATPIGSAASSPAGFDLRLAAPGDGLRDPDGLAESPARRVEVVLPPGFTLNPSAANGLCLRRCRIRDHDPARRRLSRDLEDRRDRDESPVLDEPLAGRSTSGRGGGQLRRLARPRPRRPQPPPRPLGQTAGPAATRSRHRAHRHRRRRAAAAAALQTATELSAGTQGPAGDAAELRRPLPRSRSPHMRNRPRRSRSHRR